MACFFFSGDRGGTATGCMNSRLAKWLRGQPAQGLNPLSAPRPDGRKGEGAVKMPLLCRPYVQKKRYFLFRTVLRGAGEPTGVGGRASLFIYGHRVYCGTTYRYFYALHSYVTAWCPVVHISQISLRAKTPLKHRTIVSY